MSCWETSWEASINLQTGELTWWSAYNSNSDPQASNLTQKMLIEGFEMDIKQANTTENYIKQTYIINLKWNLCLILKIYPPVPWISNSLLYICIYGDKLFNTWSSWHYDS